jgi:SAM-dependent methyltransferase
MIKRIQTIIAREKQKKPSTSGFILLFKWIVKVTSHKIEHKIMVLKKDGTFSSQDHIFMCSLFPKKILDIILQEIKPKSVLDVGCGTGVSLNYYIQNGIDAYGVENSNLAIKQSKNPGKIIKHNLNKELNLNKKFDLVWCFEVIEHIHLDYEKNILKTLSNHSNIIILSAARPGQGGHGHFNEQPREYWIERFNAMAYDYDEALSKRLIEINETHAENLMVYKARP